MGRRKSRRKPEAKKVYTIPKTFDCPFCNHEGSVEASIDKKRKIGTVRCTICDEKYHMLINNLTEAVDVYAEWIDECERVNRDSNDDDDDDFDQLEPTVENISPVATPPRQSTTTTTTSSAHT
mmetsp:Transcript_21809/g.32387  ORF Transcript_21809/g.32387 Transcript_21809/m.32387 type:complete len:123 (-) Transcript_21809:1014-1382(-)